MKALFSAAGAVASVIAASSCCLPLGTLWMAAGAAGASSLLITLRPWLLALSVLLIGFSFWQARRVKSCSRPRAVLNRVLLGLSAVFVFASILFPQVLAEWFAGVR